VKEAIEVIGQSVAASAADELRPDDWYVVGRVAESCGLAEVARRAYGRVEPGAAGRMDATSVLARRGLARLPAPARASR
jgi:hypothetical protein